MRRACASASARSRSAARRSTPARSSRLVRLHSSKAAAERRSAPSISAGLASGQLAISFPVAGSMLARAIARSPHLRLEVHAQAVGDAVDVAEVRDDLRRVVDRAVVQARRAQGLEVLLLEAPGVEGQ